MGSFIGAIFIIAAAIQISSQNQSKEIVIISTKIHQQNQEILSFRELEVLELIARGCRNREIALALVIEERTVRFHVENILDKLKVKNRAEARCFVCRNGWIND